MGLDEALDQVLATRDKPGTLDSALAALDQTMATVRQNWDAALAEYARVYSVTAKEELSRCASFRDTELALRRPPIGGTSFETLVNLYFEALRGSQKRTAATLEPAAANDRRRVLRELHRA